MIVSFTGHRLDRLGTGYSITNDRVRQYSDYLSSHLLPLIEEGANTFISGGAIGFDQIAFWTIESLKRQYSLKNILAIPFKKQSSSWKNEELVFWYEKMVYRASGVIYVDEIYEHPSSSIGEYHKDKLFMRNKFMVNNADVLVALWDGSYNSGTGHCVRYAEERGKRIIKMGLL